MPFLFNEFPNNATLAEASYLLKTDHPCERSDSESEVPSVVKSGSGGDNLFALCVRPIWLVNDYHDATLVQEFANAMAASVNDLCESLAVCGAFLEKARVDTKSPDIHQNGSYVQEFMQNSQIQGPFGLISLAACNLRLAPFGLLLVDAVQDDMVNFIVIVVSTECSSNNEEVTGRCLLQERKWNNDYPNCADTQSPDVPSSGFIGELCDQRETMIIVVFVVSAVCAGFITFLCVSRMRSGETSQMPWAISSQSISFINSSCHNMPIYSLQQRMQSTAATSDLLRSRQLATTGRAFELKTKN